VKKQELEEERSEMVIERERERGENGIERKTRVFPIPVRRSL
jgi:hypothetical protein